MDETTQNELLLNLGRLHTTTMGVDRIRRNLCLKEPDVVAWCRRQIERPGSAQERRGKNWYVRVDGCEITVNAHSYTIITAHKLKS